LIRACKGHDLIINALNPAYPLWRTELPALTTSVIAAARASGARVVIPGNVYNYGASMPQVLQEDTPWQPTTRKGRLRVEMEETYLAAGVKTLVLRAGDFIEHTGRGVGGNWFDLQIVPKVWQGRFCYPGPLDQTHAWSYLPDMARAAVMLADREDALETFQQVGFSGYALTGSELVALVEKGTGRTQKVKGLPWPIIGALGLVKADMREIHEMRYLWEVPHAVDGRLLAQLLPDFRPTPVAEAIATALPVHSDS